MSPYPPMTERETNRMVYRLGLFSRRGVDETTAEMLVDALVIRDREGDDRRVCCECANYRRGGECSSPMAARVPREHRPFSPGPTLLHRCIGFAWQTPA